MPLQTAPGVRFEKVDTGSQRIAALRTDVAAFVGVCERGPLGVPVRVGSWEQFRSAFGGLTPNAFLPWSAKAFFENGGRTCWIVRVAASAVSTTTTGVQASSRTASIVADATGFVAGGVATLSQNGISSERIIAAVTNTTIAWTRPFGDEYDLTQPIDVATGASVASGEIGGVRFEAATPGAWGNAISVRVSSSNRLGQEERVISVYERGNLREVLDENATSRFIRSMTGTLTEGFVQLAGGRDGTAALRAEDVIDGLVTVELIDEVSFVAIPDLLIERVPALEVLPDPPPPPPDPCALIPPPLVLLAEAPPPPIREQSAHFDLQDVQRVQDAMIAQCEKLHDRMALLDPPNFRVTEIEEIDHWRQRFDTKYAALYFPWVVVLDPQNSRELTRAIPPSGHVAGIWARTDLAVGVHKAPANEELRWAQDVTLEVTEALHELLNPHGINAIRALPARGLRVYGARTVSSDASWRYVNVRRLMSMIEEALEEALQWAVFEPHDFALREKVSMSIFSFLERLWEQGALAGTTAGEAFYIRCNESNNPPDAVANGQFLAEVGVAPVIPAEFVVFRIGRTEDVFETRELEGGV